MTPVFVNDVFKHYGKLYRVLYVGGPMNRIYAIELNTKNPLPVFWDLSHFTSVAFARTVQIVEAPESSRPLMVSERDQTVATKRWNRIKDLLAQHPEELLDKATRGPLLKETAANIGVSENSLLADLRRWWLGGQTQDALAGNYFRCGQIEASTEGALAVTKKGLTGDSVVVFAPANHKARGRRPVDGDYEPLAMSAGLRKSVLAVAAQFYREDETRSLRATADEVLSKLFCLRDEDGNPLRTPDGRRALLKPKGQRPSVDQIRYLLRKTLSEADLYTKRVSEAMFKNNHAPAAGSVKDDTVGPGDVYEIDATFVDLWLVSAADHVTIIGKATLYLVIDRDTRLIVGFHISLENPSWNEARQAVLSIAGDWEALCKRLAVPYKASDWVALGVTPNRLVGDRAEMLSAASNVLCEGLRIPITNPPALASQRKCIVEGGFHTTQVALKDSAPGYEPPKNARVRRGKHYDKDACLTLDQLAAIYLRIVIAHNHTVMRGYPVTPEEVSRGWLPTPISLWQRGIERRMGAPARHPYKYLRQKLMPVENGAVAVDGIHFKGCVYTFDEPQCADWLTRASLRGTFNVPVAYSTALVDEVFIFDPNDKMRQYIGKLVSDCKALAGYSFAEVAAFTRAKAKLQRDGAELNQALRVALKQDITEISAPAHAAMKAETKGKQHGSRFRNATAIRDIEARSRRRQANSLSGEHAQGAAPSDAPHQGLTPGTPDAPNVFNLDAARRRSPGPRSATSLPDEGVATECLPEDTSNFSANHYVEPDVLDDILDLIDQN